MRQWDVPVAGQFVAGQRAGSRVCPDRGKVGGRASGGGDAYLDQIRAGAETSDDDGRVYGG